MVKGVAAKSDTAKRGEKVACKIFGNVTAARGAKGAPLGLGATKAGTRTFPTNLDFLPATPTKRFDPLI